MLEVRQQFPAFLQPRDGPPLVYLDSATTALTPRVVIDAVTRELMRGGSAGRSVHALGARASEAYTHARRVVATHLGGDADQWVFVRSATEGLNLVAEGWARPRVGPGDEICVSAAEHHSNLLPWRRVCERRGARLVVVACDANGDLDLDDLQRRLNPRTCVLAVTHVSNVTGSETPIAEVAQLLASSPASDAALVVDGAQAVPHRQVDIPSLGCDFYVFAGHKAYGPQGCSAVWATARRWRQTQPLVVGGGMVTQVLSERVEYADGPARFEGGTQNVAGASGLATALEFLATHRDLTGEQVLLRTVERALTELPGVAILGRPKSRIGVLSFVVEGVHAHDVGSVLDARGVAVRAGHHCAQPLLRHFGVKHAVRVSVGLYTTGADIDRLIDALASVRHELGVARRVR